MDPIIVKALQLIAALALLVTVHEFGHYIFARKFGMRVERFYLFFNPWFSILKYFPDQGIVQIGAWTKKEGEGEYEREENKALLTLHTGKKFAPMKNGKPTWAATLYGIGWLPLGGYCSIAGMIDETTDKEKLSAEPQSWEFRAKKPVPRLLVMLAGVIMNFVLAIVIYIGIALYWGESVVSFSAATEGMDYVEQLHKAGFRDGDRIVALNGKEADVRDNGFVMDMVQDGAHVTVNRAGRDTVLVMPKGTFESLAELKSAPFAYRVPVVVLKPVAGQAAADAGILASDRILKVGNDTTPTLTEFYPALEANKGRTVPMTVLRDGKKMDIDCAVNDEGKIGIQLTPPTEIFEVERISYNILTAIPHGIAQGTTQLVTYVKSLRLLFTKSGAQQVGGFGAIGDMFPDTWNWYSFWNITAFLSVILAFMNVLPIPALDGGHVVFVLWEIMTRRKPSEKVLEYAQYAGMAFLLLLLIYANGNDIYRFFIK